MLRTLLMCTLLLPAVAFARDWQVDAAASTLGFTGSYQGEAFTGRFKSFEAQIRYDAVDLATARFDVKVDLASVDTTSSERDDTLKGSDFFAVAKFPSAHFVTSAFSAGSDGSVTAQGQLTLRDHTRPVTLKVKFAADGDHATLSVDTVLKRADFGVGSGSDWDDISAEIPVHGQLKLSAR